MTTRFGALLVTNSHFELVRYTIKMVNFLAQNMRKRKTMIRRGTSKRYKPQDCKLSTKPQRVPLSRLKMFQVQNTWQSSFFSLLAGFLSIFISCVGYRIAVFTRLSSASIPVCSYSHVVEFQRHQCSASSGDAVAFRLRYLILVDRTLQTEWNGS